jgi:hypothetical protein
MKAIHKVVARLRTLPPVEAKVVKDDAVISALAKKLGHEKSVMKRNLKDYTWRMKGKKLLFLAPSYAHGSVYVEDADLEGLGLDIPAFILWMKKVGVSNSKAPKKQSPHSPVYD